jgi:transposase
MINAVLERCAGIDIGKNFLVACVMAGAADKEPNTEVRKFGTTVSELEHLREWLRAAGCTHAALESTGVYWKPVFNVLEGTVTVILANAQQVKARKGHKTDPNDSVWLAHLLRHAMIRPSFIPPREIRELRELTRRRKQLMSAGTSERNRLQKILEQANVKIGSVLSDVFGITGQAILEALLEGKATPEEMAQLARGMAKRKIPQLIEALKGHRMTEADRFLIENCLQHMAFLEESIERLEARILKHIEEAGLNREFELLQTVPAIKQTAAAAVLAEIGFSMEPFASPGQLASWAGLCPGNNRSADKSLGTKSTKGNRWLRAALTECAWAASMQKGSVLQARFQRLVPRIGRRGAIVAVAHAMLVAVYQVLESRQPYSKETVRPTPNQTHRLVRHHFRCLQKLGMNTTLKPAVGINQQ